MQNKSLAELGRLVLENKGRRLAAMEEVCRRCDNKLSTLQGLATYHAEAYFKTPNVKHWREFQATLFTLHLLNTLDSMDPVK